jgi:hypothetical protein
MSEIIIQKSKEFKTYVEKELENPINQLAILCFSTVIAAIITML